MTNTADTLGCAQCGELQSGTRLKDGDTCPSCGVGTLTVLAGTPDAATSSVMLAWVLRDAHHQLTTFAMVIGTVLGLIFAVLVTATFNVGPFAVVLFSYFGIAGALAGSLWAPELTRALSRRKITLDRIGSRRTRAIALGAWVIVPFVLSLLVWHAGGGGAVVPALKHGVGLLWNALAKP